jgi:hypothetical protein
VKIKQQTVAKVIFRINIERDAWNYYSTINSENKWGGNFLENFTPKIIKKFKGRKWDEVKKEVLELVNQFYKHHEKEIEDKLEEIEEAWRKAEKEYFHRLRKITQHKIYAKEFKAYTTCVGRCPYYLKEDAFMISINGSVQRILVTIMHEIMHLQFHHYFEEKLKKELTNEQFQDLKEALTVLLNHDFRDLLGEEDRGYPKHKELREFIEEQWAKKKDFNSLLIKSIEYLKTKK